MCILLRLIVYALKWVTINSDNYSLVNKCGSCPRSPASDKETGPGWSILDQCWWRRQSWTLPEKAVVTLEGSIKWLTFWRQHFEIIYLKGNFVFWFNWFTLSFVLRGAEIGAKYYVVRYLLCWSWAETSLMNLVQRIIMITCSTACNGLIWHVMPICHSHQEKCRRWC